jgi:ABC-2 type transport system permease protein
MLKNAVLTIKEHGFLFSELVKRDFKKKYKRTYLGMLWSLLSPLLTLLIMSLVFKHFFGNDTPHYTIYLFCGNIVFSFFSDSTSGGMGSLLANAGIFTKINVPKYLFLFSRNVSSLINFGLTFIVFLLFCILDGVAVTPLFFTLIIPVICLVIFNLGTGLILSALFVFFRDMQYLWSVFTMLLMYLSAIFYTTDRFAEIGVEHLFLLNPVYVYIRYFRLVVIEGIFPSANLHLLAVGYAAAAFAVGALIYKKCNHKFLYYV